MSRTTRIFAAALLLCAGSAQAQIMLNHTYFVGSAARCDFPDIQSAINFAGSGDFIYVAASASAYAGHLSIVKSLNLFGTDVCGDDNPPPNTTPFATVDGSGGVDAPVIGIGGSSDVVIAGLEITGGHAGSNGFGGGIDFSSSGGSLTLSNVVLDNNSANEGGGLAITPVGTTVPNIYVNDDVEFLANTAFDSGAGLYVVGSSSVYVMGKGDLIALNTAAVSGGGIFVRGPAFVALGSPGLGGLLVYDNKAQYGGGIAAYAENADAGEQQLVSLFTTDATSPGQITGNNASVAGGGLYMKPFLGGGIGTDAAFPAFCAMDFRIDYNSAPQGAALYLEHDTSLSLPDGGRVYLNTAQCNSASDFQAVRCAPNTPCNEISGNTTVDSNNHPTDGAVVFVTGGYTYHNGNPGSAGVVAQRFVMQRNTAGYLFLSSDDDETEFLLAELLTGANTLSNEMIRMQGGELNVLDLQQCTLAPDIINSTHVLKFDNADSSNTLTLLNSIIDEPGTLTLNYPGSLNSNASLNTGYIVSNDLTTLPGNVTTVQGTPLFVDGDNADVSKRDYHLRAYVQSGHVTASPGIDFAPSGNPADTDLDLHAFDQDVPLVPNFGGPRDLGAYEAQPIADRIFADAFGDPTSLVF